MSLRTKNSKAGILDLPLEVKAMVLREVFREATVEIATPYSLPHIQQLAPINKALSVFAIEGFCGKIGEQVLLQTATFAFRNLLGFENDDMRRVSQLQYIQHVYVRPTAREIAKTLRSLTMFDSLKDVTISIVDHWPTFRPDPSPLNWVTEISLGMLMEHDKYGSVSPRKLVRTLQPYDFVVAIEFWYTPKSLLKPEVKDSERQACSVRISDRKIIQLDTFEGDEGEWRNALTEYLALEEG